jgi:hypothetical protein
MDWVRWHADYDDAASPLAQRLRVVQELIRGVLDRSTAGPITVVSMCAGQGRDLLEVLARHPRRDDVRARLVELDPDSVAVARSAGFAGVEVVESDAGLVDAYLGAVPADLVLACGVFGNITDADIERTVAVCGQLCRDGGTVVWTRHRRQPDLVPAICDWFERDGFDRVTLTRPELGYGVGAHRRTRAPEPIEAGARIFTFVGAKALLTGTSPRSGPPSPRRSTPGDPGSAARPG